MKHGFLFIDKPAGPTSHDIVAQVRRMLHERKVGHLGTLDPAATGLLVLAVGTKALKVLELFSDLPKEYDATVRLGAISTTYDREGVIEELPRKPGWEEPADIDIRRTIEDYFTGQIKQVPPIFSAVHIGGQRAHALARKGKQVDMPTRSVRISDCSILSYKHPKLELRIACSSGTYIRSLAHDLGDRLHCGGYLQALRRTKVGEWSVEFAVPPESIGWSFVTPLWEVLEPLSKLELNDEEAEDIRHGRDIKQVVLRDVIGWHEGLPIAVLEPSRKNPRNAHARKVL